MRIGVIDSGIGGLTVLKSLIKNYPNHEYIYFGDTLHIPYGEKSIEVLISYTSKIFKFLENKKVDLIIIACGTLSSNIEHLKSNIPLIDIISPLKNKLDNYYSIGIMATPLSIKTNAFQKYIKCKLNLVSCPKLVPIIEKRDFQNIDKIVEEYINKIKSSDAIILGCTHYPLIIDYIKKYYNKDIFTLDEFILPKLKDLKETKYSLKLYFSKIDDNLRKNVANILNIDDNLIEFGDVF